MENSPNRIEVVIVNGDTINWFYARPFYDVIPHFTAKELACPTSKRVKVDIRFLDRLGTLRNILDFPLSLNSCCRSTEHNKKVGGHYRSLHLMDNPHWNTLGTIACDINTVNMHPSRYAELFSTAQDLGFSIGQGLGFVHLDARDLIGLKQTEFTY